jgi:hypothetical protein
VIGGSGHPTAGCTRPSVARQRRHSPRPRRGSLREARDIDIHASGGESNGAASRPGCFGLRTAIATTTVDGVAVWMLSTLSSSWRRSVRGITLTGLLG